MGVPQGSTNAGTFDSLWIQYNTTVQCKLFYVGNFATSVTQENNWGQKGHSQDKLVVNNKEKFSKYTQTLS